MTKQQLMQELQSGEKIRLIDVRNPDEFSAGARVEGSENIPADEVLKMAEEGMISKDEKIVAICKGGKRCGMVAEELKGKGFNIDHLEGGVDAWVAPENS